MSDQPHSSWAEVYDLAYEHSFGGAYRELTRATLGLIKEHVRPPARVVDFGAGTGRLSIPLAELGYEVTAVEPSLEMLRQLERKAQHGVLHTVHSTMEDFGSIEPFDMALCVFTVVSYLLDEESLKMSAAHVSLVDGGLLLIDVPSRMLFEGFFIRDQRIERTVSVIKQVEHIFTYQEDLTVEGTNGEASRYRDSFPIRYWSREQLMAALQDVGFVLDADVSDRFPGAGSLYYVMKKQSPLSTRGSTP